jgi:hypothetical protein
MRANTQHGTGRFILRDVSLSLCHTILVSRIRMEFPRGINLGNLRNGDLCETKLVDKNGDLQYALSVTCHEKEEYFF